MTEREIVVGRVHTTHHACGCFMPEERERLVADHEAAMDRVALEIGEQMAGQYEGQLAAMTAERDALMARLEEAMKVVTTAKAFVRKLGTGRVRELNELEDAVAALFAAEREREKP